MERENATEKILGGKLLEKIHTGVAYGGVRDCVRDALWGFGDPLVNPVELPDTVAGQPLPSSTPPCVQSAAHNTPHS